ncbi:glutathione S-transferase family protein [Hydrogenophaga sp.]|uniref:glutathione S-transferase family protein n=1 Tax=Hydrogenophaga sp. TaxID=1904254 RepID=UPI002730CC60|nr:glutathione S-transferase family protein [Hydrogenophaga sp.]MDP2018227.1 glutathione S-transferase family protein [Hydrogenophaga sp.]MDP3168639.1 glutathione S-transferase family protein [Hydrogenophaga sp.]MDP3810033.1 glutathione S-transferase family protein [Hydrogenophaga sp.]
MSLTIYGIPASRTVRPLWAATELGLDFEHVKLAYQGGGTRTPEFLAINPNGHVPAVVDARPEGDVVLWESMACALYIARHHGPADGVSITPATPREDAEALRWSFWAVTETEADALTVLMHRMVMPEERRKPEMAVAAERRLAVPLRVIEQHLQKQKDAGQAFLAAARFTVADLCVASVLNWARPSQALMAAHPLTHDWILRCMARPAYVQVREFD